MSFLFNTTLLPENTRKFRENSADSNMYHHGDYTPSFPSTTSVSRILPVPRKGNMGTCKTLINTRRTVVINRGLSSERSVPVIIKIETSVPVGINLPDLLQTMQQVGGFIDTKQENMQAIQDLFLTGRLPDENYGATANPVEQPDDNPV
jgi:hypothetical protein